MLLCNGKHVLVASITEPLTGPWHADVEAQSEEDVITGVITLDDSGLTWKGTTLRSGVYAGRLIARIVGGAGGLEKICTAKSYVGASAGQVLADILKDAGETLSATASSAFLNTRLDAWQTPALEARAVLGLLCDATATSWRVLRDGTVWVGTDTFPALTFDHLELAREPELGSVTISSETFALYPGVTFAGSKIQRVEHTVQTGSRRTTYQTEGGVDFGKALKSIVRRVSGKAQKYLALYPSEVQSQDAAGLLDLLPDDPTIRGTGLSKVPIKHGLPGIKVKVPSGARVLLGFANGDPRKPYAALWDPGSVTEITFDNGTKAIARVDDEVQVTIPIGTFLVGATGAVPNPDPVTVTGKINAGNTKLKA